MKNSKPQNFEASLEELERIVRELERGDLPLEKSLELFEQGVRNREEATTEQASDPERNFSGDLCYEGENGCAGDVRLYNWEKNGYGRVRKVLFTARNGATISARIWSASIRIAGWKVKFRTCAFPTPATCISPLRKSQRRFAW